MGIFGSTSTVREIMRLKREKNAIVLAHNYQKKEIFEVADFIGDSLGLCLEASRIRCDRIVFAGVHFMAESAKLLNPNSKVLLPVQDAGCAMSDMITVESLEKEVMKWKKIHSDLVVVAYVNTTAAIKAMSDICCTSSNAVSVVKSLSSRHILFVPDKNLAKFVQKSVPEKEIIIYDGYCPIHHRIDLNYVLEAKNAHPKAKVIAHPECQPDVISISDFVCSTSTMLDTILSSEADEFILLTECGMTGRLNFAGVNKKIYTVCNMCFDMKKTALSDILHSLQTDSYEITIPASVASLACKSLHRMLSL